jgi:hypothetical protein
MFYMGRVEIGASVSAFSAGAYTTTLYAMVAIEGVHPPPPSPPSPGGANFYIMMECTPESGHCYSVCALWSWVCLSDGTKMWPELRSVSQRIATCTYTGTELLNTCKNQRTCLAMRGYAWVLLGQSHKSRALYCVIFQGRMYLPQNKSCMERLHRITRSTAHRKIILYVYSIHIQGESRDNVPRRGIIVYLEYHSVCPIVRLGPPASPSPQVCLTPWTQRGGGRGRATLSCVWGSVGSQFGRPDRKLGTLLYSVMRRTPS